MVTLVDVNSVANEISQLIGIVTVTLIPAMGGLVFGISHFIHNHTTNKAVLELTDRISKGEQKLEEINKKVADNADKIGIAVDAGAKLTGTTDAITAHDAQLKVLEQKLADIANQINTITGTVPSELFYNGSDSTSVRTSVFIALVCMSVRIKSVRNLSGIQFVILFSNVIELPGMYVPVIQELCYIHQSEYLAPESESLVGNA